MSPLARSFLTWLPLACCVLGAVAGFVLLDPAMRDGDPLLITESGRALAMQQAQGVYRLAIVGCGVSLLWAMGVRMFVPSAPSHDERTPATR